MSNLLWSQNLTQKGESGKQGWGGGMLCEALQISAQSLTREERQIPIRLLYCILSSRVPNEVGVNISCMGRMVSIIMHETPRSLNNMPQKGTTHLHSTR